MFCSSVHPGGMGEGQIAGAFSHPCRDASRHRPASGVERQALTPFRGIARNPFGWSRLSPYTPTTSLSRHTLQHDHRCTDC